MAPPRKIFCPAGHLYDEENSYHHPTKRGRVCRVCQRGHAREWARRDYAKKKAERARLKAERLARSQVEEMAEAVGL